MTQTVSNEIRIVIGSWGSYNACNERAYGSSWLDLADYSDWEEIEEKLISEGFELDGVDEELFIQDVDNISADVNWDYMHPKAFFELLLEADVLDNVHNYEVMDAFLEVRSFEDFKRLVDNHGSRWCDDINLYKGYDWKDYGQEMFENMGYEVESWILDYFDFEAYGESFKYDGDIYEYSQGIIEIFR